ncbi:hypothetical protein CLHOM_05510 [Clostridium homopropionicum DSM 5847]|uniref:Rqc2 homolog RqcH n=1 Tax=Clostridium homopropionicum DSM 5847 TaxID=1121318 RepID=A0A0L6ZDT7_9CLOT|nr:NFACT RNA binding domain-containing protein [Clostridium homopropionicum]KOA20963.1 hypothetical protein CLHOM_05510 [Clostridium homopropionicum DSM 5847]SFG00986.1 Predicted component of the ribosome quality control (RQC) complex, YloA/Tae2 family, contains fibronectin-binding (FbpA) and DUF814 domains [Clostridium homopropionicum]
MALDGVFLRSIVNELNNKILNGKVDKVNQPESDEIILSIRNGKENYKLLISSSSNYPRLHFTNMNKQNPLKAPMFCMVLRKYLTSAKIINIKQLDLDRIVTIDFESTDELGFDSVYSLAIEIMGRHSNITLIRHRDMLVMDCIKHISPDLNSYRTVLPGIKYIFPPKSNKLNPLGYEISEVKSFINDNDINFTETFFSNIFTGIGKILSKEIVHNLNQLNIFFYKDNLVQISNYFKTVMLDIKSNTFNFYEYKDGNKLLDFYCIPLNSMASLDKISYSSPSNLLEDFYYIKDKVDRLKAASSDLIKIVTNNVNRCTKKHKILTSTLKECEDKEKYKLYGELLTANIYAIEKGMKEIEVINYYSDAFDKISISLDVNKTPSQNVQSYYKRYNKLKKSEESAKDQINQNEEELEYLNSVLTNIHNVDNYNEIEDIKKELIETGYIKFKKSNKNNKTKLSKPMHYISSDGFDIYVGKNNIQNDYLSLKFANKNDIWLHTKNIPGSHVVIKANGKIPSKTLEEAANLAAYYSKSKNSSNVPVDYTEIKNLKKPNGAKPGMVIYYTNQTIYITPQEPNLKKV